MTRRRALRIAAGVLLLFAAWTVATALLARADVQRARDRIEGLRDNGGDADAAAKVLAAAERDLRHGRSTLRQPAPALVARLPVLGRSMVALRTVDTTALTVVRAARDVVAEVKVGPLVADARIDVRRLTAVAGALRTAAGRTEGVPRRLDALRTGWTLPTVGANVRHARSDLGGVPAGLRRSADALDALANVLGAHDTRRLLVVLENNAELRGTGGLVSVFAEATARDGAVHLGAFRDIVDVAESRGYARPVPAPPDYVARYGSYLANTTLWRNANMSPDVPTSAGVLAELAALSLHHKPDAIVLLDVPAIAKVLGATGPAELPDGRTLDEDDAVDELLSKTYTDVPDTRAGQDERRRRLRVAADAVVARLFAGDAPTVGLGTALADAASGRHVAIWSARPAEQAAFEAAGMAGQVRDDTTDLAAMTIHNLGGGGEEGNKLDYYARLAVRVKVRVERTYAVTERTYLLRNTAPASGLPRYVAGVEHPGQSRSLVSFALPADATIESFARDATPLTATPQREGGHLSIDDAATLDPGTDTTWTLRYRVPLRDGGYSLRVVPQPLAVDAVLALDVAPGRTAFLSGGSVRDHTTFDRERKVDVRVVRGGWWERFGRRLRRFWDEPVKLGG